LVEYAFLQASIHLVKVSCHSESSFRVLPSMQQMG
jgi:hypothetical protein